MEIEVQHEGGVGYLPIEMVREILLRLPVKSLLRFMCVSSRWKYLISHNSFRKLHREIRSLNNKNPPSLLVLHSSCHQLVLTTYNLLHGEVVQEWTLPTSLWSGLKMIRFPSQSKLVCFVNRIRFFLCNPSTRRLFHLPNPSFEPSPNSTNYGCGFGYVPYKDEYVIVHLVNKATYFPQINNWSCEILSHISIANNDGGLYYSSWRSIDVTFISHLESYCQQSGVFVCGAFYWMMFDVESNLHLISFHVENEVFSTIGLPEDLNESSDFKSLLEIKGELYFVTESDSPRTLQLWTLSDVKNQLWTQKWDISLEWVPQDPEELNLDLLVYRREYLQYYNESSFNIKLRSNKGVVGIHTSLFSL